MGDNKSPFCRPGNSEGLRSSLTGTWGKEQIGFYTTDTF